MADLTVQWIWLAGVAVVAGVVWLVATLDARRYLRSRKAREERDKDRE